MLYLVFWEIDLETNKVSFSDGWFKFLGYSTNDFNNIDTQEVMKKIIHKEDFNRIKKEVKEFLTGKSKKYDVEFRILHKDGNYIWINALGTIYNNKFFGFHIDIDDLKNANTIISEQAKMVAMGEMKGNIAHQWRQPLSVISTGATGLMLQKEYKTLTNDFFFKNCNMIDNNAQYLSKTIDDFRNFIKGERKNLNLSDNINSFLNLVEGAIKSNNLKIKKDIQENIVINSYSLTHILFQEV